MPVIKSAVKKLRQNKTKAAFNLVKKKQLKKVLDNYRKKPSAKALSEVFSILDKSGKSRVLHKNKVARLKSRLSKKVSGTKSALQK